MSQLVVAGTVEFVVGSVHTSHWSGQSSKVEWTVVQSEATGFLLKMSLSSDETVTSYHSCQMI